MILAALTIIPLSAALLLPGADLSACELQSPDGQVLVQLRLTEEGALRYAASYRGQTVLAESSLGLALTGTTSLENGFRIVDTARTSRDTTWQPVYGERSQVRDRYNELVVDLRQDAALPRRLQLTLRAYNEGFALAYTLPEQPELKRVRIARENTEFRFTADHSAWAVYSAQGRYEEVKLSQVKSGCERPLVVKIDDRTYAAVAEARLVDYTRMKLGPLAGVPYALRSELSSEVEAELPLVTPWRVVMFAPSPSKLLEQNDLILSLNDPCQIEDTSWIKPGKVIREVTLTTAGGKACVDFAAKRNLQYVEFDAGWYGHEYSDESDATTVSVDPQRSPGPLDLPEVIRYANERGIGILLYVNRRALERQLDEILPLYRQWGIRGLKYGFVNVGSQAWTSWLHEAVRKAADQQLMVDIHDEYRPTGYSRTYPNLMTQEGIAGDETRPTNQQTLTILFTRMLTGAADNTICYYDSRVEENACHAYQLAKSVCLYSPWQFLYWYDRPSASPRRSGGAGGSRNVIGDEPELEFFDRVPTVWDDTRVLDGQIGEYAVMARRSGEEWFLGAMNSETPRTLAVPLDFLDPQKSYTARIYSHDPSVLTRTHVRIDNRPVDATTRLTIPLERNTGQAVWIH